MSFSGFFFVARSDGPIAELPSIRAATGSFRGAPDLNQIFGVEIGPQILGVRSDGPWQRMQCTASEISVSAMVAETGAPALAIYAFGGDFASVDGASPTGDDWFGNLNPDGARMYGAPDAGPVAEVAARAAAWAVEAGLTPDQRLISTAIGMRPGPSSAGVDEFLKALGFRFGAGPLAEAGA